MRRPLLYDMTHLANRLSAASPAGIDKVDLAYARHFSSDAAGLAGTVRYGRGRPSISEPHKLRELVRLIDLRWRETQSADADIEFLRTRAWLHGERSVDPPPRRSWVRSLKASLSADLGMHKHVWRARLKIGPDAPENALYLNVAQHALEHAAYFRWLSGRRDIRAVFFLHDLLPLDFPEFWWSGHERLFQRRMDNLFRHAAALITTSEAVRERALVELKRRGRPEIPILASPPPSPLAAEADDPRDDALASRPYFVAVGTIEPRKNHLLLLNIWRDLAAAPGPTPKLVIVGARGWENEQVVDMLARSPAIVEHVLEAKGLSNAGLRRLMANARAVLSPSFAEGFGLPIIEALSLGAPVVASNIPVFREVGKNRALLRDAIDGRGWREAITALTDRASPLSISARGNAAMFRGVDSPTYFAGVAAFLSGL